MGTKPKLAISGNNMPSSVRRAARSRRSRDRAGGGSKAVRLQGSLRNHPPSRDVGSRFAIPLPSSLRRAAGSPHFKLDHYRISPIRTVISRWQGCNRCVRISWLCSVLLTWN